MHGFSIRLGNDSQIFANIKNERPATNTPVGLYFCADGVIQDMRDPFVFEIGSTQQDAGNKILRCFHRHAQITLKKDPDGGEGGADEGFWVEADSQRRG